MRTTKGTWAKFPRSSKKAEESACGRTRTGLMREAAFEIKLGR
jgi:hypothetical protein